MPRAQKAIRDNPNEKQPMHPMHPMHKPIRQFEDKARLPHPQKAIWDNPKEKQPAPTWKGHPPPRRPGMSKDIPREFQPGPPQKIQTKVQRPTKAEAIKDFPWTKKPDGFHKAPRQAGKDIPFPQGPLDKQALALQKPHRPPEARKGNAIERQPGAFGKQPQHPKPEAGKYHPKEKAKQKSIPTGKDIDLSSYPMQKPHDKLQKMQQPAHQIQTAKDIDLSSYPTQKQPEKLQKMQQPPQHPAI